MIIKEIKVSKILSETNIKLADYVINPYKGCQFGCIYCYTQKNKSISKINIEWGNYVFVKKNAVDLLKKEIEIKKPKRILIGSVTEPLQNCEEKYKITFQILSFLKEKNLPVVILTKSTLIKSYLELLNYSKENLIFFTFNSFEVHKLFENNFCDYSKRIETIEKIFQSNLNLIVYISPFFPFITDYKKIFEILKNRTNKIYFEAYNLKMGNWKNVKEKLTSDLKTIYEKIFFQEDEYYKFWNSLKNEIQEENKKYNFDIKFFIPEFDEYYKQNFY